MKSITMQLLCRFMIVAMLSLSFQTASAAIIGTDKAAVATSAQTDRALIVATLSRTDIANQLQAQGVDPMLAQERVAAMTDQEARSLADSIATAPAGAGASFLILVAIGVGVWYLVYRK